MLQVRNTPRTMPLALCEGVQRGRDASGALTSLDRGDLLGMGVHGISMVMRRTP